MDGNSNILFLLWDSCRTEDAYETTDTLQELAANNLQFERAIAPGRWSLPSHASLFTGDHPSEHEIFRPGKDRFDAAHLVTALQDDGYRTHAATSNGFVSHHYGLDDHFDDYTYTMPSVFNLHNSGLDVKEAFDTAKQNGLSTPRLLTQLLRDAIRHEDPVQSISNIGIGALRKLIGVSRGDAYLNSARRTTRPIRDAFDHHEDDAQPFFIFANYMDAHGPYFPHEQLSRLETLRRARDIHSLNSRIVHPYRFLEEHTTIGIDDADITRLRELYDLSVKTLDDNLATILDSLDEHGLREDTLIVIAADHGQLLGEVDSRGERRFGHIETVDDAVLTVPLVIAHPDLESARISQPVEIRNLPTVFEQRPQSTSGFVEALRPADGEIVVECPATLNEDTQETYPDVPDYVFERQLFEHTVVVYDDPWKLARITNGEAWAWYEGEETSPDAVPADLHETADDHLERLTRAASATGAGETARDGLDDEVEQQLADLGYK